MCFKLFMRAHLACITSTIFHLLARIGPFKFKHFSAQFEGSPECCSVIRDGSLPAYSSQINQCAFHKNSFHFPTAYKAPHLFLYVAGSLRKGSLATNMKTDLSLFSRSSPLGLRHTSQSAAPAALWPICAAFQPRTGPDCSQRYASLSSIFST